MTAAETLRSIAELAELMQRFADDPAELASLSARLSARLEQLDRQIFVETV